MTRKSQFIMGGQFKKMIKKKLNPTSIGIQIHHGHKK